MKKQPDIPWSVYGYTTVSSLSTFVAGYNNGLISALILHVILNIPFSIYELSMIVGILLIGSITGILTCGHIADAYGRRPLFAANALLVIFSSVLSATAESTWILYTGRFILGYAVGVSSVVPNLYINEIAPDHLKSKFKLFNYISGWMGLISSFFISYFVGVWADDRVGWRYMFLTGAVPSILLFMLVMAFLPETPTWLANNGHHEAALHVLDRIYGSSESSVISAYQNISSSPHPNTQAETNSQGAYTKCLARSIATQFFQQVSGNGAIVFYSAMIFHEMGFEIDEAILYNALASIPQIILLIAIPFVCVEVRKPIMLLSTLGVVTSLALMGFAFQVDVLGRKFWFIFIGILLHRFSFTLGLGRITMTTNQLQSVSLSDKERGQISAISLLIGWIVNLVIVISFPILLVFTDPTIVFGTLAALSAMGFIFFKLIKFGEKETPPAMIASPVVSYTTESEIPSPTSHLSTHSWGSPPLRTPSRN